MERSFPSESAVRSVLHHVVDVLVDLVLERRASISVDSSANERERPVRPAATARRRRAPRMPPVIERTLEVSADNRQRARQALLRRGVALRSKEESA
jgi:hypothetical protein